MTRPKKQSPTGPEKKRSTKPKTESSYHHGSLRQALIEAVLALAQEGGTEAITVREAARRAGVSPAAPFRHFADKADLMTAVAEDATRKLAAAIAARHPKSKGKPRQDLKTLGESYLAWARDNPTHFEIVSNRKALKFEASTEITQDNDGIRASIHTILAQAQANGALRPADIETALLMCRTFVYGLARMRHDGHFPSWGVPVEETAAAESRLLSAFIDLLITDA
jgi:AcrR family transcriptional regulator